MEMERHLRIDPQYAATRSSGGIRIVTGESGNFHRLDAGFALFSCVADQLSLSCGVPPPPTCRPMTITPAACRSRPQARQLRRRDLRPSQPRQQPLRMTATLAERQFHPSTSIRSSWQRGRQPVRCDRRTASMARSIRTPDLLSAISWMEPAIPPPSASATVITTGPAAKETTGMAAGARSSSPRRTHRTGTTCSAAIRRPVQSGDPQPGKQYDPSVQFHEPASGWRELLLPRWQRPLPEGQHVRLCALRHRQPQGWRTVQTPIAAARNPKTRTARLPRHRCCLSDARLSRDG